MRMACLLLIAVALVPSVAFALSRTYQEGVNGYSGCEDTYMIEYRFESNYGSAIYIECQNEDGRLGGSEMKPLIRFNNLGLAGCQAVACTLSLYCYFATGENQTIQLHEMLRPWHEFEVNCHRYRMNSAWLDTACGANDIDAVSSCVSSLVDPGGWGWKSFALPPSLVQKWIDAPGDVNDGLLVWAPEVGQIKDRSFRSSDMFAVNLRPQLTIHYRLPCTDAAEAPRITSIADVPDDSGGMVAITWTASIYDRDGSSPGVKRYRVWRRAALSPDPLLGSAPEPKPRTGGSHEAAEEGALWELVGMVRAARECHYTFIAPTACDSSNMGPCCAEFYVSAHTNLLNQRFESPHVHGCAVNNLGTGNDLSKTEGAGDSWDEDAKVQHLGVSGENPSVAGFGLTFCLAVPDHARLDIFDVAGRHIASLVDAHLSGGRFVARWDCLAQGQPIPPGVYIARLATSSGVHSKKLVLLE